MFGDSKEDQLWQVMNSADRTDGSLSAIKDLEEDLPSHEEAEVLAVIEQHVNDLRNEVRKALIAELKA